MRCEWMGLWNEGRKEINIDKGSKKKAERRMKKKYRHLKKEGMEEMRMGGLKVWMDGWMDEWMDGWWEKKDGRIDEGREKG